MSSRRTLVLIGALLAGAVAALLMVRYVRGVEERAGADNSLAEVWVAAGPLARGTSADIAIDGALLTPAKRRAADIPPNAVRRPEEIRGNVAAIDLQGGEILTTSMFLRQTDLTSSKSVLLEPGNVAMTLQLDQAAAVGGIIQPGDRVNILANTNVSAASGDSGAGADASGGAGATSRRVLAQPKAYVYQNVKVLAVDRTFVEPVKAAAGETAAAPAFAGLITIEVPPTVAPLIASAQGNGLQLTLNPTSYQPVPAPAPAPMAEFPGEQGRTPYDKVG